MEPPGSLDLMAACTMASTRGLRGALDWAARAGATTKSRAPSASGPRGNAMPDSGEKGWVKGVDTEAKRSPFVARPVSVLTPSFIVLYETFLARPGAWCAAAP